ncbi:hypothetical protein BC831DRAFT_515562 [Entophlyctis helioformis]|nr:hypothetical protein BC831DRAFT_515562 [Entophlyctis helioformis]
MLITARFPIEADAFDRMARVFPASESIESIGRASGSHISTGIEPASVEVLDTFDDDFNDDPAQPYQPAATAAPSKVEAGKATVASGPNYIATAHGSGAGVNTPRAPMPSRLPPLGSTSLDGSGGFLAASLSASGASASARHAASPGPSAFAPAPRSAVGDGWASLSFGSKSSSLAASSGGGARGASHHALTTTGHSDDYAHIVSIAPSSAHEAGVASITSVSSSDSSQLASLVVTDRDLNAGHGINTRDVRDAPEHANGHYFAAAQDETGDTGGLGTGFQHSQASSTRAQQTLDADGGDGLAITIMEESDGVVEFVADASQDDIGQPASIQITSKAIASHAASEHRVPDKADADMLDVGDLDQVDAFDYDQAIASIADHSGRAKPPSDASAPARVDMANSDMNGDSDIDISDTDVAQVSLDSVAQAADAHVQDHAEQAPSDNQDAVESLHSIHQSIPSLTHARPGAKHAGHTEQQSDRAAATATVPHGNDPPASQQQDTQVFDEIDEMLDQVQDAPPQTMATSGISQRQQPFHQVYSSPPAPATANDLSSDASPFHQEQQQHGQSQPEQSDMPGTARFGGTEASAASYPAGPATADGGMMHSSGLQHKLKTGKTPVLHAQDQFTPFMAITASETQDQHHQMPHDGYDNSPDHRFSMRTDSNLITEPSFTAYGTMGDDQVLANIHTSDPSLLMSIISDLSDDGDAQPPPPPQSHAPQGQQQARPLQELPQQHSPQTAPKAAQQTIAANTNDVTEVEMMSPPSQRSHADRAQSQEQQAVTQLTIQPPKPPKPQPQKEALPNGIRKAAAWDSTPDGDAQQQQQHHTRQKERGRPGAGKQSPVPWHVRLVDLILCRRSKGIDPE